MPTGLKVVVSVNVLVTLFIVTFAAVMGDAVPPAGFFSAPRIELELVPIPQAADPAFAPAGPAAPARGSTPIEVLQAYRSTDLSIAPWGCSPTFVSG